MGKDTVLDDAVMTLLLRVGSEISFCDNPASTLGFIRVRGLPPEGDVRGACASPALDLLGRQLS